MKSLLICPQVFENQAVCMTRIVAKSKGTATRDVYFDREEVRAPPSRVLYTFILLLFRIFRLNILPCWIIQLAFEILS